jgi:peptidoglycan/LPS O-acetylase OafA/YrhL
MHRPISVALQTIYVWTMTFALMGLFRKLLTQESKTFRYLSDSSYWLYLAHLPLIMAAQLAVRDWQLPAIVKFGLVCVVVSGFLLLTYQTLVRYTWLGTLLNGPRRRPEKAASQTAA